MRRPAFIPVPRIVLNIIFNEERAKVSLIVICYFIAVKKCINN